MLCATAVTVLCSNRLPLCYLFSLPSSAQVRETLGTERFPFPPKSQCWPITMEQRLSQCWDACEKPNPERDGWQLTVTSILRHNPRRRDSHVQFTKVCTNKSWFNRHAFSVQWRYSQISFYLNDINASMPVCLFVCQSLATCGRGHACLKFLRVWVKHCTKWQPHQRDRACIKGRFMTLPLRRAAWGVQSCTHQERWAVDGNFSTKPESEKGWRERQGGRGGTWKAKQTLKSHLIFLIKARY